MLRSDLKELRSSQSQERQREIGKQLQEERRRRYLAEREEKEKEEKEAGQWVWITQRAGSWLTRTEKDFWGGMRGVMLGMCAQLNEEGPKGVSIDGKVERWDNRGGIVKMHARDGVTEHAVIVQVKRIDLIGRRLTKMEAGK